MRHHALQEQVKILSEEIEGFRRFDDMLGISRPMQELFDQLRGSQTRKRRC